MLSRNRTTWTNIRPVDPAYTWAMYHLIYITLPQIAEIPQKVDEALRQRFKPKGDSDE